MTLKQFIGRYVAVGLQYTHRDRLPVVRPVVVPYEREGMKDVRFFLGTKTGLMYFDGRELLRLFEGRVYGITQYDGRWYASWNHPVALAGKRLSTMASIISFVFEDEQIIDLRVEAAPVDREVHQIDAWDGHLHVTDTANNRVLVYQIGSDGLTYICAQYPSGRLRNGKQSPNYVHVNSVFKRGDRIYLMYHNQTQKTGRNSQVALLFPDWSSAHVFATDADSAHNVYFDGDTLIYCDSMNGRLVSGGYTVFATQIYLRGLAVTRQRILVGGSAFAERDKRYTTTGYVYEWHRERGQLCGTMRIPGAGSIYEVRITSTVDLAMSSSATAQEEADLAA